MIGCPHNLRPTRDNTLGVDDNPSKEILSPTSYYIVCPTRTLGKLQDQFLFNLGRYFHALVGNMLIVPRSVRSNLIVTHGCQLVLPGFGPSHE